MINVFKAQNVNFLSGDEKITRHSGLKNKMFLSSDFFRVTKFKEIRSHQRFTERWRDSVLLRPSGLLCTNACRC